MARFVIHDPPLARPTHYTEEPSRLSTTYGSGHGSAQGSALVRVHGGGFVTRDMLEQTVEELRASAREARLGALLVDLRAVAGYESACLLPVRQFLREAPALGVHRIAVVATSSVLRTASRLATQGMMVELRTFDHEPAALQWVHPPSAVGPSPVASSPVMPRPRATSSSEAAAVP